MISSFILAQMNPPQTMPRKTIYIPEDVEMTVRDHAVEGESFSATITRLIELGAREDEHPVPLDYIGSGNSGLPDLGINAEKYLGLKPWGPGEGPSDEDPD
jgi:predicted CopG family antitoxin